MEIMEPGGDPFEKSIIQPSMEKFVEETKQNHEKEEIVSSTTLVGNGCVDIRGKVADKQTTGGWKAAPFIIVREEVEWILNRMTGFLTSVLSLETLRLSVGVDHPVRSLTHRPRWAKAHS
ncbi:hypothetical protein QQP08_022263 [Theobroma cacao]|nr:hypothetical protein QQP08_022263 [Theobroma cacao]